MIPSDLKTQDVIQIYLLAVQFLTFSVLFFTLFWIRRQFHAAYTDLQIGMRMHRRALFSTTTVLTEDEVRTMMLHAFEHFDKDTYENCYKGHPDRIRSYLLMKVKYLYLQTVTSFETDGSDFARKGPDIWLEELCQYKEFRDVHQRQGYYYPSFKETVDAAIKKIPNQLPDRGWATEFLSGQP